VQGYGEWPWSFLGFFVTHSISRSGSPSLYPPLSFPICFRPGVSTANTILWVPPTPLGASSRPLAETASREALERESNLRSWNSLFASKVNLRRFNQGSILSHISCFFRITLEILFMEFAFCALQLEGFEGGRRFGGLPRISPWASFCGEVCYSKIMS
jgi:hypothetical protein